jgi:cap2 methyltransferase
MSQFKQLGWLDLVISDDSPRLPYIEQATRGKGRVETNTLKWGQRKLFMGELLWLLSCRIDQHPDPIIVYVGAAPGTHLPLLVDLFPKAHFILYDLAPFKCPPHERVTIIEDYFDDERARELAEHRDRIFFASDIRNVSQSIHMTSSESNVNVERDMETQWRWVRLIRPYSSMLKFRLPYPSKKSPAAPYRYAMGTLVYQPWAGVTSTESRLIIRQDQVDQDFDYHTGDYESLMFYHNMVRRMTEHRTLVKSAGLNGDFDSAAEELIWSMLLRVSGREVNEHNVALLSSKLDDCLGATLAERRVWFRERLEQNAREADEREKARRNKARV